MNPYGNLEDDKKVLVLEDVDLSLTYSYANYLTWLFDDRVELINGKVFKMSPAPSPIHQEISGNLYSLLRNHPDKKPCMVYYAPFGEWKGNNNYVSFYKFFHASSSSGVNQLSDKTFSEA